MESSVLLGRNIILACLVMVLGAGAAYAQPPDPAQTIKDEIQSVLDRTDAVAVKLASLCSDDECRTSPAGAVFKRKMERLRDSQARVREAHGRADYKELLRRRPKHKSEECNPEIQVCIESGVTALVAAPPGSEFDDARGNDMIEDLEEVSTDVDELDAILASYVPPGPDPELAAVEYSVPRSLHPSFGLAYGAFLASQVALKVSAIANHGCEQTAVALGFGGNSSVACIVVETVFQSLDYVYQVIDFYSDEITANEVTATLKRTENLFTQLKNTDSNVDWMVTAVQGMLSKLQVLEDNQKRIIELLKTAPGLRPGFPNPK